MKTNNYLNESAMCVASQQRVLFSVIMVLNELGNSSVRQHFEGTAHKNMSSWLNELGLHILKIFRLDDKPQAAILLHVVSECETFQSESLHTSSLLSRPQSLTVSQCCLCSHWDYVKH